MNIRVSRLALQDARQPQSLYTDGQDRRMDSCYAEYQKVFLAKSFSLEKDGSPA
jgi:hypothetical protein